MSLSEPGRLIAGNAGLLVSSVIYVKAGEGRDFLILDAAMNDLMRPSLYSAWQDIVPLRQRDDQRGLAGTTRHQVADRDHRDVEPVTAQLMMILDIIPARFRR